MITHIVLATIAGLLFSIGLFIALMNWTYVLSWYLMREHYSLLPILGGSLCAIGIAIAPLDGVRLFWPLPLLCDIGSVPLVIFALVAHWRRRK